MCATRRGLFPSPLWQGNRICGRNDAATPPVVIPAEAVFLDRESRNPVNTGRCCDATRQDPFVRWLLGPGSARARLRRARLAGMTSHMQSPWLMVGGHCIVGFIGREARGGARDTTDAKESAPKNPRPRIAVLEAGHCQDGNGTDPDQERRERAEIAVERKSTSCAHGEPPQQSAVRV
jgi:hypothetical protein